MSENVTAEMSFVEHLIELRDRLLRVVLTLIVVMLVCMPFANYLYGILAAPLLQHMPEGTSMIATQVASPFLTPFKMVMWLSIFLTVPVILYQAWAFIAPWPVQAREAACRAARHHQHTSFLRWDGFCLLRRVSVGISFSYWIRR